MPTPDIYAKMSDADLMALKAGQYDRISTEGLQLMRGGAAQSPGELPVEAAPFKQQAHDQMMGENPGAGAFLKAVAAGGSALPGLPGAVGGYLGSPMEDVVEGREPSQGRALLKGGLLGALGLFGKGAAALDRYRLAGTGKAKDAALVADAIRGTGTALQPKGGTADLMEWMRGTTGAKAMGAAKDVSDDLIAKQLPPAPTPIDKGSRSYLDSVVSRTAPPDPVPPALSGPEYLARTKELSDLGNRGFSIKGLFRDSPEAVQARQLHGEKLGELKDKVAAQGGPGLLRDVEKGRRDFSAGTELRRLFRPNSGEGPDRVFRPGGFNMQDVQERAGRRVGEIQGRLGQSEGDEFLKKLFRGGKPGEGTDRPVSIPLSKFKGLSIPLPVERLAGPSRIDPRLLQMLLQAGGDLGMP